MRTEKVVAAGDRPSQTAEVMALFRALESSRATNERLFIDPLAKHFLRAWGRALVMLARMPPAYRLIARIIDHKWSGARTSAVARTRLIDAAVCGAVTDGHTQVLLLGAGFDTRAHRLPEIACARVFEVDRSATQREKIRRVARWARPPLNPVRYISLDFRRQSLASALEASGFYSTARTMAIWEGVTNYLSESDVDTTFRAVTQSVGVGSQILFTYVHSGLLNGAVTFAGGATILERVRQAGEPWVFGFDPQELASYLAARGLTLLEDQSADEYRQRYFGRAAALMSGYSFYRVALARKADVPPISNPPEP